MSHSHQNTIRSQKGASSATVSFTKKPAILLVKHIQISELQDKNERSKKFLSFGPNPRPKLEFFIDNNRRRTTTETKYIKKKKTVWSEHLTFELSPPIEDTLFVKCYDMSRNGNDGLFGESEVKLSSYEGQRGKVNLVLLKYEKEVGKVSFDIYFLSGYPPKDADLNLRDGSSSNDIIGVLLLKNITCKGMSKKGHLEFVFNNGAKTHTTEKYWKMTPEICEYPIAFNLVAKKIKICIQYQYSSLLTGFAKTKFEIRSAETWRSLMESGTLKSGDLVFVENGFDAGYTRFKVSFHALTTFKQIIKENSQGVARQVTETTSETSRASSIVNFNENNVQKILQIEPKEETKQITNIEISSKDLGQYLAEKPQSPIQTRSNTFTSTSSFANTFSSGIRSNPSTENYGSVKIVCSKYLILSSVENNPEYRQYRNRLYKGHNIYNLDQVIIKVFERQTSWENERNFLCKLNSKYVVKWIDMEINRHLDGGFVSITSYAGENLETNELIFKDPIEKKRILLSISKATEFLHGEKIAHLDLKPANIICKPNNLHKIRLCDFESAKNFGDYLQSNYDHFRSCGFSAPEIVQHTTIKVTSAQDIFSLGCIFYFIHTNKLIYDDFDDLSDSTCSDWFRGDIFDTQAASIILRMLNWVPSDRPTIQEIINSDYFKEGSNQLSSES
ncbi:4135_t:CDS:10 [Ambispora leptoticha]|uniref:4135_t:CDS:1 n=1 Tax=Ambispora leptoticha TaxID=144679 RepID=A0A9N9BHL3_9GLOM|nr:4135_t:CDS:10 [Ambispora leptoticha]